MSSWLLSVTGGFRTAGRDRVAEPVRTVHPLQKWDPGRFANQQFRGLVRQIFCSSPTPARQVVFSATESDTDVGDLCRRVGETLAQETLRDIAVVSREAVGGLENPTANRIPVVGSACTSPLRDVATRTQSHMWLVPAPESREQGASAATLHSFLGEIRRQFEYSIVEAPPACESSEAIAMAQFADGIILVLSAQRTRRVTAEKLREVLEAAQVRLLGTVLSGREFPMPEGLYRRL
jgi:hypothetical protein